MEDESQVKNLKKEQSYNFSRNKFQSLLPSSYPQDALEAEDGGEHVVEVLERLVHIGVFHHRVLEGERDAAQKYHKQDGVFKVGARRDRVDLQAEPERTQSHC